MTKDISNHSLSPRGENPRQIREPSLVLPNDTNINLQNAQNMDNIQNLPQSQRFPSYNQRFSPLSQPLASRNQRILSQNNQRQQNNRDQAAQVIPRQDTLNGIIVHFSSGAIFASWEILKKLMIQKFGNSSLVSAASIFGTILTNNVIAKCTSIINGIYSRIFHRRPIQPPS